MKDRNRTQADRFRKGEEGFEVLTHIHAPFRKPRGVFRAGIERLRSEGREVRIQQAQPRLVIPTFRKEMGKALEKRIRHYRNRRTEEASSREPERLVFELLGTFLVK